MLVKLFEKILLKQLLPILEEKQVIPSRQFGFRRQHSSFEQVQGILHVFEKAFNKKKSLQLHFLMSTKLWTECCILVSSIKLMLLSRVSTFFICIVLTR